MFSALKILLCIRISKLYFRPLIPAGHHLKVTMITSSRATSLIVKWQPTKVYMEVNTYTVLKSTYQTSEYWVNYC